MKQAKKVQEHECPLCKKPWYSYSKHIDFNRVCSFCTRRQRRFDADEQEHAEYRWLKEQR